jgi:hypothetical protein
LAGEILSEIGFSSHLLTKTKDLPLSSGWFGRNSRRQDLNGFGGIPASEVLHRPEVPVHCVVRDREMVTIRGWSRAEWRGVGPEYACVSGEIDIEQSPGAKASPDKQAFAVGGPVQRMEI